jgi:Domain of unknown function (DUF5666)
MFSRVNAAVVVLIAAFGLHAQDAATPAAKQPLEHVLGTVTALSATDHTVTVKDDKSGTEYTVQLANTKTLLKVDPGAKDLRSASRITADDLQAGDRVDVRGLKPPDNPNILAARSVVLMSARDLAQAHQAQAAEWQHATAGIVSSLDTAAGKVSITSKTAEGAKAIVLNTASDTQFTRYAPENPKTPAPSQLAQLQIGDQVRVIGEKNADGTEITAKRIYSGAFRTISATVVTIAADGKSATVKDLASKKPVEIALNDDSTLRKLPPMMAAMLARRFNPAAGATPAGANAAANASAAPRPSEPAAGGSPDGAPGAGGMRRGNGDMSQLLERAPKITVADLKAGDALVISGVATGSDSSHILASNVIAGVEPILQASPARQGGQNLSGDWGLGEMATPQ